MSQTGTKDSRTDVPLTHLDNRWAEAFSLGWSYQPGLKVSLVSGAKNIGTKANFRSGSKVVSLLVEVQNFGNLILSPHLPNSPSTNFFPLSLSSLFRALSRWRQAQHGAASSEGRGAAAQQLRPASGHLGRGGTTLQQRRSPC